MFRNPKIFHGPNLPFKRRYSMLIAKEIIKTTFTKEDVPPIDVPEVPISRYGGETTVSLLTGSKVGKQGAEYIKTIFEHIHAPIEFEMLSSSGKQIVPNEFLLSVMRNGTALHIDASHQKEIKQQSLVMNTQLDLYACVVNCFTIPGFSKKFPPADIAIVMQNNRGDFSKLEYEPVKGLVETLKITDSGSVKRYIEFAFKYATKQKRKRITFGHKIDEVPLYDGLHLKVAKKLQAKKYPKIEIEFMAVNRIVRHLIMDPSRFDVLCLNDKYGTFVTSIVSGICGGASLFSSSELGDHHAIFKPLETKLSITSTRPLSPYGTIATATNLLLYLGYRNCASTLWRSLVKVMVLDNIKTAEFGGDCTEEEVICKLLNALQHSACQHT